ncbi:uncharacterized protein BT62DRAFT_920229 [Guyanagaster necrorhizus]|uniref:Uncharacterized protein n=1 Tax=Guyanagaster necrorhizus TaxID=856835 RepID=A0A9P8ARW1_9AGAR|nr:uncharacterized protein BT62DRAFT_920229 [Guyanagaster necrorhizus MCA 3950]KAG7445505.1 hypothetical protein BT62DRAFT_920229 [Guyanagaster necrorhizus MCA 3950]
MPLSVGLEFDATIQKATSQSDASDSAFQSRFGIGLVSPIFYETEGNEWRDEIREDRFTLLQLKRVAMLVCRFETAQDSLHPVHRIKDHDNILSNRFNDALKDLSLSEIYARIQNVTDVTGLAALLNFVSREESEASSYDGYQDSKFFKVWEVNFTSLIKHDTIEFRQHEGTISGSSALRWAEFIVRFTFALTASDTEVMSDGDTLKDLNSLVYLPQ